MGRSFFQRASWRISDYAALGFGLFLVAQNLAWRAVDVRDYIDIQAISIEPTAQGDPIVMSVVRLIGRDFSGGYNVSIRDENEGSFCTTGNVDLQYKASAALRDPLYLSYWAGGGSCQGRIPSDLDVGLHNVRTCHFVNAPWFVLARKERCVNALLEILPREETE